MRLKSYCMGCGHPLPWGATCKVCPKVDPDANVADLAQAVVDRDAAIALLTRERDEARAEVERLRGVKDGAYEERNRVVAVVVRMAIALGWPAGIGQHEDKPGEDWDPEWRTIVVVQTPMGQASWHLHDSHKHLFDWAPVYSPTWDGHTTEEKYARLDTYARSPSNPGEHDK